MTAPRNDDDIFAVAVERDGSPPLVIRAAPTGRIGGPFGAPAGPADLGGVSGTVYERPAASGYEVRWTVGDLTYVLEADPGEGRSVTLAQFRQLLRSLRWDR